MSKFKRFSILFLTLVILLMLSGCFHARGFYINDIIGIIVIILFMAQIITMIITVIQITIENITGDNYVALRKLG